MNEIREERTTLWSRFVCQFESASSKQAQRKFLVWTFVWAFTFVLATAVLTRDEAAPAALAWTVALVPTLVGIGAVMSFLAYLASADELMRRIQFEALGIAFGGGLLFVFGYQLAEMAGAPEIDMSTLSMVLIALWVAGQVVSTRRYK